MVYAVLPSIGYLRVEAPLLRVAEVGVMLFCVLATARKRPVMIAATLLAIGGEISFAFLPELREIFNIVFFVIVSWVVLADVIAGDEVSSDKILGAICGYLLVGMAFAVIYSVLERYSQGSFTVVDPDIHTFLYFSLVTLSTLGYGDIVPVTHQARALTGMEAVIGQFYIAVVVARLVSLHLLESNRAVRAADEAYSLSSQSQESGS